MNGKCRAHLKVASDIRNTKKNGRRGERGRTFRCSSSRLRSDESVLYSSCILEFRMRLHEARGMADLQLERDGSAKNAEADQQRVEIIGHEWTNETRGKK
jgi:hypothetical protein